MIKMGAMMNEYAPVADRHTGERRKVLHLGDIGNPFSALERGI